MEQKENQRRSQRIPLHLPIQYRIRGQTEFRNAVCDNISAGGISFITDEFLAPETLLMLEVRVLSRALRPVGKITWSSNLAHSGRNRLGIRFLEIDNSERDYLKDYIDMQTGN